MKFLKQKLTRVIAFISACILTAVCVFRFAAALNEHDELIDRRSRWENYLSSYDYYEEVNNLYNRLWLVGNMYLRWLDKNGEFTGTPELKASTEQVLKELGYMDSEGKLTVFDSEMLEYRVSYGDYEFSNTDKSFESLFNEKYSLIYRNNAIENYPYNLSWYNEDCHWYSTNYGMYYYYYGNGRGAAVFDYDTSELDYYVDDLGARIYYKTDGTTPIPFTDEYDFYTEGEPPTEAVTEIYEAPEDYELKEGFLFYSADEGKWIRVENDSFIKVPGDESLLRICITPLASVIAEYEQAEQKYEAETESFMRSLVNLIPYAILTLLLTVYVLAAGGYSVKKGRFVLSGFDKTVFGEFPILLIVAACMGAVLLISYNRPYAIRSFLLSYYNTAEAFPWLYSAAYTVIFAVIVGMLNSLIIRLKCKSFWKTTLTGRIISWAFSKLKETRMTITTAIVSREMLRDDVFMRRFILRLGLFGISEILLIMITANCGMPLEIPAVCTLLLLALYVLLNLRDLKDLGKLSKQISDMNGGDYSKREAPESAVTYGMTQKLNNISDGIQTAVERQVKSERMKIDLVTNVSHDLKTPLTSIISYINLLSMEELSPEAKDYVKILEQKSQRLSAIVSDLFDLAKATSRTDISPEMIDAVILIGQVLGDMTDRINSFGREIRTDISMESAPIYAEGKKLYRVLQNLIDNSLKYSLENTRIYLSLYKDTGDAVITIKNISAYEMKFTPDEITERFTRGDESRSSEGNGLGLSIAKSFTEACGGKFRVIVDGDVFAAEVRFPIVTADKENEINE